VFRRFIIIIIIIIIINDNTAVAYAPVLLKCMHGGNVTLVEICVPRTKKDKRNVRRDWSGKCTINIFRLYMYSGPSRREVRKTVCKIFRITFTQLLLWYEKSVIYVPIEFYFEKTVGL
jgi:hypothetical protein